MRDTIDGRLASRRLKPVKNTSNANANPHSDEIKPTSRTCAASKTPIAPKKTAFCRPVRSEISMGGTINATLTTITGR